MTIGQLAKKTELSIQTIRYYEFVKLLPKPNRKESGYREYTEDFIDKIDFIKNAKGLGFTLSEIRSIIKTDECKDINELTLNKLNEVKIKISKSKKLEKKLILLLKKCPNKGSIDKCSIITSFKNNKE